ncbi:hypothetical protein Cni_G19273 [Canna indica]|uniref:C2H2-type domain-containing protein n=1 Tax=Canna indica TaxID=4628 RepID=A0AAQ3QID3_9LILI|nr:hypothetical protein Cni_G19273 [Canna indica]
MEKHRCSLCSRRFSSGRALGGHMRSHVAAAASKPNLQRQHRAAASSSSAGYAVAAGAEQELISEAVCGLMENSLGKSFTYLVDHEFSSAATPAVSSSVVVQDNESENELPRATAAVHRRRSKRARFARSRKSPDPMSSASGVTTEEEIARCLMMLSRDFWAAGVKDQEASDGDGNEGNVRPLTARSRPPRRERSKYQCGKCKKVFRSNQALGNHHHRPGGCISTVPPSTNGGGDVFECPFCFRVFASGQALGGHKRSHLTPSTATSITITSPESVPPPLSSSPSTSTAAAEKYGNGLATIDLNLPAAVDDDVICCFGPHSELQIQHWNES